MKKPEIILLLIFFLIAFQNIFLTAQVKTIKNGIELNTSELNLRVQFYDDNIIRILKWNKEGTPDKLSLSVIKDSFPDLNIKIKHEDGAVTLSSKNLTLKISNKEGSIQYLNSKNEIILKENGAASFSPVIYSSDSGFSIKQNFQLTPDEGIYGLGQNQEGYFNYRGKKEVLVQTNTDAVTPFLISTQNYGILWDNYSKTIFDDSTMVLHYGRIWGTTLIIILFVVRTWMMLFPVIVN